MEPNRFTFLNSTGTPSLSQPAAKKMRAHVTKSNFAKRRQRIARTAGANTESTTDERRVPEERNGDVDFLNGKWTGFDNSALQKIQELLYLEGRQAADNPTEAAWFNLIASEPAMVEATMAVALQHWSPSNSWQRKADYHLYKAVSLTKQRIASAASRSDGVLGAVVTMAFGASLENNQLAWNVHIDGLAHIIKERESRVPNSLPSWFIDLIVQDSINNIFGFPRVWHPTILSALGDYHQQSIPKLVATCDSVVQLGKVITSHHDSPFDTPLIAQEIEEPLARLHYEARSLRASDNLHIDAAARAIELVLYLLWPSQSTAHLTLLAGELGAVMRRFPVQGCSYMQLTSFQLMVGAVAAEEGSAARAWFIDILSTSVRCMQLRGWQEPLNLLKLRPASDIGLIDRFRHLWKELQKSDAPLGV
ncbi:uncharacterized protein BJX67DRAFT_317822 [Aspergillus lucknowensis]|uniref:Uncharacterized protein n=1 Tax=Aspergillus lucknowensis TaxID=176173 RepID=A0ABR4L8V5_9EURO